MVDLPQSWTHPSKQTMGALELGSAWSFTSWAIETARGQSFEIIARSLGKSILFENSH